MKSRPPRFTVVIAAEPSQVCLPLRNRYLTAKWLSPVLWTSTSAIGSDNEP
ncbi:hypothetical protein [Rhizobium changzhiense]|uniref:Uncharacterized protein n=1 Tax=Rhizobium changzhiense TaxID=2692317 RepID=A0ABR6A2A9_9HYPH|nr:hypothetical protein [Rhizobium changzhiense]MBA5800728.1 hypothetical protein [Rhizobium changzhiense]